MHATPQFYVRLARGMLRDRPELARRYLTLRRRRKVLRAAVKRAHHQAIYESPLADVGLACIQKAAMRVLTVMPAEESAAGFGGVAGCRPRAIHSPISRS